MYIHTDRQTDRHIYIYIYREICLKRCRRRVFDSLEEPKISCGVPAALPAGAEPRRTGKNNSPNRKEPNR